MVRLRGDVFSYFFVFLARAYVHYIKGTYLLGIAASNPAPGGEGARGIQVPGHDIWDEVYDGWYPIPYLVLA